MAHGSSTFTHDWHTRGPNRRALGRAAHPPPGTASSRRGALCTPWQPFLPKNGRLGSIQGGCARVRIWLAGRVLAVCCPACGTRPDPVQCPVPARCPQPAASPLRLTCRRPPLRVARASFLLSIRVGASRAAREVALSRNPNPNSNPNPMSEVVIVVINRKEPYPSAGRSV